LPPISTAIKIRQGRKTVTVITGFEPYGITAEFLADELKKVCASATSIAPLAGASKGSNAMEVMVQGKHLLTVSKLLQARGIPKKRIQEADFVRKNGNH
jgi:translation initiation factor 2D